MCYPHTAGKEIPEHREGKNAENTALDQPPLTQCKYSHVAASAFQLPAEAHRAMEGKDL